MEGSPCYRPRPDVAADARHVVREVEALSFDADADHVAETLEELAAATEALQSESDAPAADWADATTWTRVVDLLVDDLRAVLADLRTLADREVDQMPDALERRVANLGRRVEDLTESLAERADLCGTTGSATTSTRSSATPR